MKTEKPSYILITGANGEVGHGLINKLKKLRKEEIMNIIALDLNDLDRTLKDNTAVFVKGSVTDKDLLSDIFSKYKIDTVYHLAAVLDESHTLLWHINVDGAKNVVELCKKYNAKMIYLSSSGVFLNWSR